jgi:hypothetical protein
MSTSSLFDSPRLKLRGANEELEALKAAIAAYRDSNAYELVVDPDPERPNGDIHKIKVRAPPDRLGLLCARIASEMRDALDQTGYAAAVAGGHIKPTKAYFPICKDDSQFDNCVRQNCRHLPPDIVTLFRAFKAHPSGDRLLVALNNVAGFGKHCVVRPVAQGIGGDFHTRLEIAECPDHFLPVNYPKWDPLKNEVILFHVGKGTKLKYQANLSIYIAFGEVDFVAGQEVAAFFDALSGKVEGIIAATEAECRRLGFIA